MRVAVDFKVVSTEAALRGMGRYTQQQVREALRADPELEVFLLLHGDLASASTLLDWAAQPRVHPIPLRADDAAWRLNHSPSFGDVLSYSRRLDATLRNIGAEVYHSTVPFMVPFHTAVTACPVVSTFYDCIPLVFPAFYFNGVIGREHYLLSLQNVVRSDRVIAISQSARSDLRLYTGYDAARTHVAYPIVDDLCRPALAGEDDRAELAASLGWLPPRGFILSVTGVHRSKNVGLLLEAYTMARARGLDRPLVIVLPHRWAIEFFEGTYGRLEGIELLADVSDADLARLYRLAEFVMQPSAYEGFGYPLAEAMASGAAVISTDAASLPEIAGDAAILVSPVDREQTARALLRLDADAALREDLRRRAPGRAALFKNPDELGRTTVAAYRAAVAGSSAVRRPRVAIWSSMPPLDCGIGDYTAELAGALARTHDVEVYTDGSYFPTPPASTDVVFRHPASHGRITEPAPTIFQVGGRSYQGFMYERMRERGGIAALHDLSMGMGFYANSETRQRLEWFEDEVLAAEGAKAYNAYGRTMVGGEPPLLPQFLSLFDRHRLLRWIVDRAERVVVHTEVMRQELLRDYPGTEAHVVRMGVQDPLPGLRHHPLALWRLALGVGRLGLVVGSFGIVDRVKRLDVVVGAFEALAATRPDSLLLIVGRAYDADHAAELCARIAASPAGPRIVMLDYAQPAAFRALLQLTDVVVNLRWPTRLGLSAVLLRALAAGKPTIVTDVPEWRSIGGEALLRIAPDAAERDTLHRHLESLAADPAARAERSAGLRRWFLANGTPEVMAADYLRATDIGQPEGMRAG